MPDFELEDKYKSKEKLSDLIDDITGKVDDKYLDKYGYDDDYGKKKKSGDASSSSGDGKSDLTLSDEEAKKLCKEWKTNYSVITGVSWGNLPYDLQQKWIANSCDYHLAD